MLQQPSGRFSLISRTRRYSANGGAVPLDESSCRLSFVSETRGANLGEAPTRKNIVVDLNLDTDMDIIDIVSCRSCQVAPNPKTHLASVLPPPSHTPTPPPPTAHPKPRGAAADCHSPTDCGPQAEELDAAQLSLVCPVVRRDEPWSRRSERRAVNIYWGLLPPPFHRP